MSLMNNSIISFRSEEKYVNEVVTEEIALRFSYPNKTYQVFPDNFRNNLWQK